jgi:hypothetical protein
MTQPALFDPQPYAVVPLTTETLSADPSPCCPVSTRQAPDFQATAASRRGTTRSAERHRVAVQGLRFPCPLGPLSKVHLSGDGRRRVANVVGRVGTNGPRFPQCRHRLSRLVSRLCRLRAEARMSRGVVSDRHPAHAVMGRAAPRVTGEWLVARRPVHATYPCRCRLGKPCGTASTDAERSRWCSCYGRTDLDRRLPSHCCARRAAKSTLETQ